MILKGRVFLVEKDGRLIPDIDTDQIYHNAYLHITDMEEMGKYAFSNLEGFKDFSKTPHDGEILVVGSNFGAGSSRQHAVDCFKALGIKGIIGISFGAIYWRNAINNGLAVMKCPELQSYLDRGLLKNRMEVEVDLENGVVKIENKEVIKCIPLSKVEIEILEKGGLLELGR